MMPKIETWLATIAHLDGKPHMHSDVECFAILNKWQNTAGLHPIFGITRCPDVQCTRLEVLLTGGGQRDRKGLGGTCSSCAMMS